MTPAQCWGQDLAQGLNYSGSSWVHGCGRMGQTIRCFIVCWSPHSHVVCSSLLSPHFCIRDLHRPVPVRRRFRLDQVGHTSLEPGGSDSLGLNESLWGVVWRWLDQRGSLRVRESKTFLMPYARVLVSSLVTSWSSFSVPPVRSKSSRKRSLLTTLSFISTVMATSSLMSWIMFSRKRFNIVDDAIVSLTHPTRHPILRLSLPQSKQYWLTTSSKQSCPTLARPSMPSTKQCMRPWLPIYDLPMYQSLSLLEAIR